MIKNFIIKQIFHYRSLPENFYKNVELRILTIFESRLAREINFFLRGDALKKISPKL